MAETDKKPTLGRKIFIAAVLTLILVGLPAISWVYLQNGLNWRKSAVGELGTYGQIPKAYMHWADGTKENRLKSKVVVAHVFEPQPDLTPENRKIMDINERLFNQFGANLSFCLAMVAEGGTAEFRSYAQKQPNYDYANTVWVPGGGSWTTIMTNGFESYYVRSKIKPYPYYYALTDTGGVIRRFYNAMDEKEVGRMVEQIAILLPQK